MKWGTVYSAGDGPITAVETAVLRQLDERNLPYRLEREGHGVRILSQARFARFHRLHKWLTQTTMWEIVPSPEGTLLRQDHWWAWRPRVAALSLFVAIVISWTNGIRGILDAEGFASPRPFTENIRGVAFLACAYVGVLVLFALARGRSLRSAILADVRAELEAGGWRLDLKGTGARHRDAGWQVSLMALLLGIALFIILRHQALGVWYTVSESAPSIVGASLLFLCVFIAASLGAIVLFLARPGFGQRFLLANHGFMITVGIAALLAGLLFPYWLLGQLHLGAWDRVFAIREAAEHDQGPWLMSNDRWMTAADVRMEYLLPLQNGLRFVLLTVTGLWVIGIGFLLWSVPSARGVRQEAMRLQRGADGASQFARSGRRVLGPIRGAIISMWLALSLLNGFLTTAYVVLVLDAIGGSDWSLMPKPVGASDPDRERNAGPIVGVAHSVSLLFHLPAGHPTALFVTYAVYVLGAGLVPAAVASSMADYVISRSRMRRRLRLWTRSPPSGVAVESIRDLLSQVCDRACVPSPRLAIAPCRLPHGAAYEFTGSRRGRVVMITAACCEALDRDEITALMAHETCHLLNGHCRWHNRLQLLGRLTLVGGSFVGIVEDSFGHELEADRTAVEVFGVDPAVLGRCLQKMHWLAALEGAVANPSTNNTGLRLMGAIETGGSLEDGHLGWFSHVRQSVRTWIAVFRGDQQIAYWHPSVQQRIDALRRMSSDVDGRTTASASDVC